MKRFTILAGILILVLSFCLFISFGAPPVGAEETTTTTLSEEVTTVTTAGEEPVTTTTVHEMTQEEIEAILAQLNLSGFADSLWSSMTAKFPWLIPLLAMLGVSGVGGLLLLVVKVGKWGKALFSGDAQLDKDIVATGSKLESIIKSNESSEKKIAELSAIVTPVVRLSTITAKALNVLVSASKNDDVVAQAAAIRADYAKATGDLTAVLVGTSSGQDLLKQASEIAALVPPASKPAN